MFSKYASLERPPETLKSVTTRKNYKLDHFSFNLFCICMFLCGSSSIHTGTACQMDKAKCSKREKINKKQFKIIFWLWYVHFKIEESRSLIVILLCFLNWIFYPCLAECRATLELLKGLGIYRKIRSIS